MKDNSQRTVKTSVMRLDTGEIWVYALPPKEAVRNAFMQSFGRHDISAYPPADAVVKISGNGATVYAGDFVAMAKKDIDILANM